MGTVFKSMLGAAVLVGGLAIATQADAAVPGATVASGTRAALSTAAQPSVEPVYWARRHGRRVWIEPRRYRRY